MDRFDTWVYLSGCPPDSLPGGNITLVTSDAPRVPILESLIRSLQVARHARQAKLDVIVCNPGLILAGLLAKRLRPGLRLVLDVRSIPVEVSTLRARLAQLLFELALRSHSLDALSVITPQMRDQLLAHHPRLWSLPNTTWASGFDHQIFQPAAAHPNYSLPVYLEGRFVLMFHGTMSPSRGLQQSIHALDRLHQGGMTDVVLFFLGHGRAQSELAQLAVVLGLERSVIFHPPVAHERVPSFLAAADLGIDPLPDHPWWRYQSPLKVFECLAMGVPVLATDIPCHQGISRAVLLVADNAPCHLAEAVVAYRQLSPESRETLQCTAITDASDHTWAKRACTLSEFILNQVMGK